MKKELIILDIGDIIYDDSFNCRGKITPVTCRELSETIKLEGLHQPVVVAPAIEGKYKLVMGHRRFIAISKCLRRSKIEAIIDPSFEDAHTARIANLTENIQRQNLTVLQEIRSINAMLKLGLLLDEIAGRCGRTKGWVKQRIKISELPAIMQQEIDAGLIKMNQVTELHDYNGLKCKKKLYAIAKAMKHSNVNHRNYDNTKHLSRTNKRQSRSKAEIQAMLQHFLGYFEPNLASRMLAWASGELDDKSLHSFIERYAQENDYELMIGITSYEKPF